MFTEIPEQEASSNITVDLRKKFFSSEVIGKKRKREQMSKSEEKDKMDIKKFSTTMYEYRNEFESLGIITDSNLGGYCYKSEEKKNIITSLSMLNFNIYNYIRVDNNKINKLFENYLNKEENYFYDKSIKEDIEKIKKSCNTYNGDIIHNFNNIDLNNTILFELFSKVLNYYDNQLNDNDYEIDTLNWKDIFNKNVEKVASYRDLYVKKLKFTNKVDQLYERILNRSLIYMINKKNFKVDSDLNNALNSSIKLLNYGSKLPFIRNRFKNRIRSLYSDDNLCVMKYITYIIYFINKGLDIPDSLIYNIISDKEKNKPKRGRTPNIVSLSTLSSTNTFSPRKTINKKEKVKDDKKYSISRQSYSENNNGKNIIKIETSSFLDKDDNKKINNTHNNSELFKPNNHNFLVNFNVNLNVNVNLNLSNKNNEKRNSIIKIGYDSLKNINFNNNNNNDDDDKTITVNSENDDTLSSMSIKEEKKLERNKIFQVDKIRKEENFQLYKSIDFEINPKRNKKI